MDPDPVIFVTFKASTTKNSKFFGFFKVHLHHFSKIKSHKEFAKQYLGITVFLTILLDDRRIRIRISDKWIPKTYGSGFRSGSATLVRRIHVCIENADPDPKA
jgi:hypothetical protein